MHNLYREVLEEDFFVYSLPCGVTDSFVKGVFAELTRFGIYDEATESWNCLPKKPSAVAGHGATVYQPLTKIFDEVVAAAQKLNKKLVQNFRLEIHRQTPMISGETSDVRLDSRPDAFLVISDHALKNMEKDMEKRMSKDGWKENMGSSRTTADADDSPQAESVGKGILVRKIALTGEFKKQASTSNVDDNNAKILWNMASILSYDPCRRFSFGFTIESCTMSIWLLSRSSFLRSKSFDLQKEPLALIRTFLFFAFSSPQDMGWDPSITFCPSDSTEDTYLIVAGNHVYRTCYFLADSSKDHPFGRCSRVWKVVDSAGKIHALKDLWMEFDRPEEHTIYQQILADIASASDRNTVSQALLTPIAYGRVEVSGKPDDTQDVILQGYNDQETSFGQLTTVPVVKFNPTMLVSLGPSHPDDEDRAPEDPDTSEDTNISDDAGTTEDDEMPEFALRCAQFRQLSSRRYHYRIVYEECATTISRTTKLENVVLAIIQIVTALGVMNCAGWVHRDISAANLYYYKLDNTERGLIGDLEYARRHGQSSIHSVRTGTPAYMAIEASARSYLFRPSSFKPRDLFKPSSFKRCTAKAKVEDPPFSHNFIHDLESVWWVLVSVLILNDGSKDGKLVESLQKTSRQALMSQLFSKSGSATARHAILLSPKFEHTVSSLFQPLVEAVRSLACVLHAAYQQAEENYPSIDLSHCPAAHCHFRTFLEDIRPEIEGIALIPVKQLAYDVLQAHKRSMGSMEEPSIEDSASKKRLRAASNSTILSSTSTPDL
ncbi:hypothetical protein GYMLUDRAFT_261240 [Collybiopsis luxurians FD-317 M1]|uniref:Fungal-type protein kinase domain-containing protein n=1 Tax=Collybiopsis luxurians FD-317 M1 TaxID=944289 RepID=A0A0D0BYK6_9AGAR|nr:hypothetical protein GYMLUDRAFT_261240 [Collybiopsis luxurians FD-317 M1]